ncbi:MAG TPA: 4-alpha-glucanotransferase [Verrucomicrobiae bacterium]|jgi:4-alpha-glucanotransferase|nr:4-alpha-glucanotransferase [Verrucomicrobiae bacterium]
MLLERSAGILLHPTSLPSHAGIGDLGPEAYAFAGFLARARQGIWQVLPLSPPGLGNSPYSAISAFAGNPLLISLERLADRGWLSKDRLTSQPADRIDFDQVKAYKLPLLRESAQKLLEATGAGRGRFESFKQENAGWLEDFVLFTVMRQVHGGSTWTSWPRELARREEDGLRRFGIAHQRELEIERAIQFAFFEQWRALRSYCARHGIKIVGDVAIFVNYDSADVWRNPELFYLDDNLQPTVVAGVPPDAFSATGQRWGNPLYRWDVLQARDYDWWVHRLSWALKTCDFLRLDHFRGFESYWEIPASEPTAVRGRWVRGPQDHLFQVLRSRLGELPFIAEDLGLITSEVHALRQRLEMPGMKVLQFGFGNPGAHVYLPHKFEPNCVVYTGTHDNDTTAGWWKAGATKAEKNSAAAYVGAAKDGINWAFIRAALGSVARMAIVPLQDVLGLGSEARMNTPSQSNGNWGWRFPAGSLSDVLAEKLAALSTVCDRAPALSSAEQQSQEVREDFAA